MANNKSWFMSSIECEARGIANQINGLPSEDRADILSKVLYILGTNIKYDGLEHVGPDPISVDLCGCDTDGDIFIYKDKRVYINLKEEYMKGYRAGKSDKED